MNMWNDDYGGVGVSDVLVRQASLLRQACLIDARVARLRVSAADAIVQRRLVSKRNILAGGG
jgi:hypothetical protein